jgi:hypothetical protein
MGWTTGGLISSNGRSLIFATTPGANPGGTKDKVAGM